MKNALIYLKDDKSVPYGELQEIEAVFSPHGIFFNTVVVLDTDDDLSFKRNVVELKQTTDNLFIFVSSNTEFDYKSLIVDATERELFENDVAIKLIEEYVDTHGGLVDRDYALIPVDATVIPNRNDQFQGFMIEEASFSLVVLPCDIKSLVPMCASFVIPYFQNKYALGTERFVFKYFGAKSVISKTLDDINSEFDGAFVFNVSGRYGDFLVEIDFLQNEENLKSDVLRCVIERLKDNVYAEFDTTLSQRLFDVLSLKNVKISVSESFTGGRIVSSIISNPGASKYVHEGVVSYSNLSKVKRLSVKEGDLATVGAVSPEVAYQMAKGLLNEGGCDLSISTTGIAGPKSDDSKKPVGLCYIGIGTKNGIHVYKYNFSGDRETITEMAKNTALFLAIKKLKNL